MQIKITPEQLREGRSYLAGQRQEAMVALDNIKKRVDAVCDNWEGASQINFVVDFNTLYDNISKSLPSTVIAVEDMLKAQADKFEATDNA